MRFQKQNVDEICSNTVFSSRELQTVSFGVDELLKLEAVRVIEALTRNTELDTSKSLHLTIRIEER